MRMNTPDAQIKKFSIYNITVHVFQRTTHYSNIIVKNMFNFKFFRVWVGSDNECTYKS